MSHFLCLVLHAHLPFVRHPEHDRFLEENWLYEAVAETYLPLLGNLAAWEREGLPGRLTLTLSPTLCAMLRDPLLMRRCARYLEERVELAEREAHRTRWDPRQPLALFYEQRFRETRDLFAALKGDLTGAFRGFQDRGRIEIITCSATHAVLPLLADDPPALRAQLLAARDDYQVCFGRPPRGLWLPECAYTPALDPFLKEAGLRWFILDSHGLLHASPRPRYAVFAPILTENGLAAFGRDLESARQVWSRHEGYPGDPRYREFYRDAGYDLDLEYLRPFLAAPEHRGFTGIKYHRVSGKSGKKELYLRADALQAADTHARHFVAARAAQADRLGALFARSAVIVCPYDAELFGHWWYEGPEFLDRIVRLMALKPSGLQLATPAECLREQPLNQVATPAASSWGEGGHWQMWVHPANAWIHPHLRIAQARMTELAGRGESPDAVANRALRQAGRELLLAQASDWPFILRTGTSPEYAQRRVTRHLARFTQLYDQLTRGPVAAASLAAMESQDNLFPELDCSHWRAAL